MPTSPRVRALLAAAVLLAIAGVVFAVLNLTRAQAPSVSQSAPPPTATPSPTEPALTQPEPFRVSIRKARGVATDNALLFGRRPDERPKVAKQAARAAADALQRYLNAAFVSPKTRFTAAPIRTLLTPRAFDELGATDRRALGVGAPAIDGGKTGKAVARALVMYRHAKPVAVTLRYRAGMRAAFGQRTQPLVQRGTLVFVRVDKGWRADMAEVRLRLPKPSTGGPAKPTPTPTPTEEASS